METLSISDFNFFLFLIPGFLMVWGFRRFTNRTTTGDFELLGLSVFWGLVNLALWELIVKKDLVTKTLENTYGAALILCIFAIFFAYAGAWFAVQEEWLTLKKFLKPKPIKYKKK